MAGAAGVTCFEHGTYLDEPTAELMASAGASPVPTFMVLEVMRQRSESWGIGPDLLERMAGVSEAMQESLQLARAAGVRIGSGSDLLGAQQVGRAFEIELKARMIGFRDALCAATIGNAEIMGLDADLGTVESGKLADLIVVDGNPFDDPAVLSDPEKVKVVIKSGVVVKDIR